jgi:formyltetrahydrofolate dehydrogenase
MIIDILGDKTTAAYSAAREVVVSLGHTVCDGHFYKELAIAPLLTEKLSVEDLYDPALGTLIFHPSPLPHGRGASSIKWAYKRSEPITAATWFWADEGLDTGPICEQEIIRIDYSLRPREFYERDIIPAMARTLERSLIALEMGFKREIQQVNRYASFDKKI